MRGVWWGILAAEAVLALGAGVALGPVTWEYIGDGVARAAGTDAGGASHGSDSSGSGASAPDAAGTDGGDSDAAEGAGGGSSADAGRPPASLPAVSDTLLEIKPMSADAVSDIMALAKRFGMKKIARIDVQGDYTQVSGQRAGKPFRIQIGDDRSVTVYDSAASADDPLDNPAAVAKLDITKVVAKARKQLKTKTKVSYVTISHDDWWSHTDTVGVQFAGSKRPSYVEFRVKGLKTLMAY